ncbi:ligand-binding sensor domain-containing protein [Flavisolibacter tropicus]|uniref:ligand-binding sensor domain-containing protein n=1 Tax=Flavisolibacter tropicus TaxID=1492898 RepID=UPI000ADCD494|nr:two-component regulator propeller domain-containing protein [Flavisolibacter tropicus]
MRNIYLALLLFIAVPLTLLGQQARQYSFKHFSTLNGLVSNSANAIVQDREGYIWIATTHGLQRYDGNTFLTFKSTEGNTSAIPSTNIVSLFTDQKNRLWLEGEDHTIGVFDTKKFVFRKAELPKNVVPNSYQQFVELPKGELLLLANSGDVFLYSETSNQFSLANNKLPMPKGWKFSHVTWDASIRKFWISADSGIVQLDPATMRLNYRGHNYDNDPVINSLSDARGLTDLTIDPAGRILGIIQEKSSIAPRFFYYNPQSRQFSVSSLADHIGVWHIHTDGFLLQRSGRIWLYGMPFLAEWDNKSNFFRPVVKGAESQQNGYFNRIAQAFEDRENNIWVATDNGVLLFNPDAQVFSNYDLIRPGEPASYDLVQAIAETVDDRIFVGTWRGGIYSYDKNLNPIALPPVLKARGRSLSVADMQEQVLTGDLWITQEEGRIDVFHPKTNTVTTVQDSVFNKSTIRQITEDTSGNMWFGTQAGRLIKWDYKSAGGNQQKGYRIVLENLGIIRKVHYDYQGYIWVGTAQNGLFKVSTRTNKIVKKFTTDGPADERLFINSVKDITYYNDTTLLVAAGCLNIINKRTNKITFIGTKEGLPSNTVESVQKDRNKIVWMGMTNGISRLNLEKRIISFYDRRDGINYDKFIQTGVRQLSGGRIFFFTDHNFMVFDPTKVSPKVQPPKPFITSIKIAGYPLSVDSLLSAKRVVLRYNNTSISIDFSAMSFLTQQKLHYYYKLENLDKEWIHTDRPITAFYNYLPPGQYTFYVKTETIDGVSNENIAQFTIVVRAPFWLSWWFYGLIALTFIGVWLLVDRERTNKRRSLLQVRNEIASNLHNDISITLSDINILSEMAKIKADKNVEQSKEFIDQINEKSRYTIAAMDDMLWSIDPANDSMANTLQRIKKITSELQELSGVAIDLIIDNKLDALELEMKLRHDIFFLYKDALLFLSGNGSVKQVFVNMKMSGTNNSLLLEILFDRPANLRDFDLQLKRGIEKRLRSLPATMDYIAESRHVSLAFTIRLK